MDFFTYQYEASKTIHDSLKKDKGEMLMNSVLGLAGEAGEVIDAIKKTKYQGHAFERTKILHEAGDVLWYISELCTALDCRLEDLAKMNIAKLRQRYGEHFEAEKSYNRKDNM